jgi:endonuclease/exonuclease/phosphatase family metal-dependent hydrolase
MSQKKFLLLFLVLLAMLLSVVCRKEPPLAPPPQTVEKSLSEELQSEESAQSLSKAGRDGVIVMTRNVYVGANVDVVLAAPSPEQVPILVAQAFQQLLSTNFPERAKALAKEIAATRPHLVGLQEISLIRTQSPGDAVVGGTTPAENVLYDFLAILLEALEKRGLRYRVAGKIQNTDVEVPMLVNASPPAFDDVRLTDFDIILARHDVKISNVTKKNYDTRFVVPALGAEIRRGFVAANAKVGRKTYRFVNTHLEPAPTDDLLPIQLGQAQELVAALQNETLPVIVAGDLNTPAPTGATYQFLNSQGYVDVWTRNFNPFAGPGYTCCHDPDLRNTEVHLDQRLDLILVKDGEERLKEPVFALVIGDEPRDRTPSGLRPSDHAGVVAGMRLR